MGRPRTPAGPSRPVAEVGLGAASPRRSSRALRKVAAYLAEQAETWKLATVQASAAAIAAAVIVGCGGNDRAPTSPSPPTVTQPTFVAEDVSGCYRVEQEGEWMLASVSFALTNTCDVSVKSSFLYVVWVNGIYIQCSHRPTSMSPGNSHNLRFGGLSGTTDAGCLGLDGGPRPENVIPSAVFVERSQFWHLYGASYEAAWAWVACDGRLTQPCGFTRWPFDQTGFQVW